MFSDISRFFLGVISGNINPRGATGDKSRVLGNPKPGKFEKSALSFCGKISYQHVLCVVRQHPDNTTRMLKWWILNARLEQTASAHRDMPYPTDEPDDPLPSIQSLDTLPFYTPP